MRLVRKSLTPERYFFESHQLDSVDNFLDLGILLDLKLNFIEHITMTANKGRAILGFVKRWAYEFKDMLRRVCNTASVYITCKTSVGIWILNIGPFI